MSLKTKSQEYAANVASYLRARNAVLWVSTREEARVERCLIEAAGAAGYMARTWDCGQGVAEADGRSRPDIGSTDPSEMFEAIRNRSNERCVWIMRDLPAWLSGSIGIMPLRQLRNLARSLPGKPRESAQAIVILTPSSDVPPELAGHATVLDWPLPDRAEIASILDAAIAGLPEELQANAAPNGQREAAIDAAIGLSGEEAAANYARSLVQSRTIDPVLVANEKKLVISKEKVLEWYDPVPGGFDAIGGLENAKAWLLSRTQAFSKEARAYGLPTPKGLFLAGVPGCGKSLFAKVAATILQCPLLRADLNALKGKFVGQSEANLRRMFQVAEALGRCIIWVDEIEKALAGATSGSADGGVSADALGALLSWMQERKGEAFVIATANDVSALPPELMRKGRFDEFFFVDLPNGQERFAVVQAALMSNGRKDHNIDVMSVGNACKDFTGAEIAALVPEAMFRAFADGGREITTKDLLDVAAETVPMAKTQAERVERLRAWAKGRARNASAVEKAVEKVAGQTKLRVLDI